METFSDWVKEQLKTRHWSIRELSRQSGVSHPMLSQGMSGKANLSADSVIKIAQALNVAPETALRLAGFLSAEAEFSPADESVRDVAIQEIIELAKNMTPENKQDLLDYARFRYRQQQKRDD